jgi:hypothetical protein
MILIAGDQQNGMGVAVGEHSNRYDVSAIIDRDSGYQCGIRGVNKQRLEVN